MGVASRDGQTSSEKMPPAPAPTLPNFPFFQIRAKLIIFLCTCFHLVPISGLRWRAMSSKICGILGLWTLRMVVSHEGNTRVPVPAERFELEGVGEITLSCWQS